MLKKYILVMDMCKFVVILILYFSSSSCYPAKPLNERSPELTWEAWLLVDDQNQNKQPSDTVLRRRITPKSVFIAPTFSPDSLPACAEGYSSDHLGRCIKIIKLDQAAHYDFLIEKLKEKFSPVDYDDDDYYDDDVPTPGPFQVNIPLGIQNDQSDEDIEESDVAIIVSPTMPQFNNNKGNVGKRDSLNDEAEQELFLKELVKPTTLPVVPTTTDRITTVFTESTDNSDNTVTETDSTTVTMESTTSVDTTNTDATTETKLTTASPKYDLLGSVTSQSQSDLVRFPDEPKPLTQNFHFRFPDDLGITPTYVPHSTNHMPRAIDTEARQVDEPEINFDLLNFRDAHATVAPQETSNRRNRDKNNGLFLLPPRWSDSNYQRPVVLRFSRKHAYLDMEQFKKPNYYRSIPTDDFAYLFKFKHKQSNPR